jgi:hypothetical protein
MGHLNEEELYAQALAEAESGQHRPGLWAKAFADADGDLNRAKALYVKLRVQAERDKETEELRAKKAEQLSCLSRGSAINRQTPPGVAKVYDVSPWR